MSIFKNYKLPATIIIIIMLTGGSVYLIKNCIFNPHEQSKTTKKEAGNIAPKMDLKSPGRYIIDVGGYKGVLFLSSSKGKYYGWMQFKNWGRGVEEPLKNLIIKSNSIRFKRSVASPAELKRTGSKRYFTQQYFGKFNSAGNKIQGYYIEGGSEINWTAGR